MNILNVRFRLEKVQLIVFHYELPSISQSKVKKSFQKLHNIIQNHIDYKRSNPVFMAPFWMKINHCQQHLWNYSLTTTKSTRFFSSFPMSVIDFFQEDFFNKYFLRFQCLQKLWPYENPNQSELVNCYSWPVQPKIRIPKPL